MHCCATKSIKRDLDAIVRLCTGFVKLLSPHAKTKDDIPRMNL